ncbi:reverse transcriptase domain-containing protein [Tanacetum coccineum]
MAFIYSSNTNSGKSEVSIVQGVSTSGVQVSTTRNDVAATVLAMILFWKKTGKKITIQGFDVAEFEKSKVECFNCHTMVHFARECRAPRSQDKRRRESYKKDPKVEEPPPKAMIAIDGIRWDWSYMADKDENHALVANEEEVYDDSYYSLMAKSSSSLDNEDKTGLGLNEYIVVPLLCTMVYFTTKNDLSWTGLPEFIDDTVTDYSRPTPSIDVPRDVKMYRNTSQSPKVMSNNFSAPIIKEWDSEDESEVDFTLNETVRSSFEQEKFDKSTKEVVGKKETPKQNHPRGNQRN